MLVNLVENYYAFADVAHTWMHAHPMAADMLALVSIAYILGFVALCVKLKNA